MLSLNVEAQAAATPYGIALSTATGDGNVCLFASRIASHPRYTYLGYRPRWHPSVRLSVCPFLLTRFNCLTFELEFLYAYGSS